MNNKQFKKRNHKGDAGNILTALEKRGFVSLEMDYLSKYLNKGHKVALSNIKNAYIKIAEKEGKLSSRHFIDAVYLITNERRVYTVGEFSYHLDLIKSEDILTLDKLKAIRAKYEAKAFNDYMKEKKNHVKKTAKEMLEYIYPEATEEQIKSGVDSELSKITKESIKVEVERMCDKYYEQFKDELTYEYRTKGKHLFINRSNKHWGFESSNDEQNTIKVKVEYEIEVEYEF